MSRLRFKLLQWSGHTDARPTEFAATEFSSDRPGASFGTRADADTDAGTATAATATYRGAGPEASVSRIGRYLINGGLGAGGLGEVFEAWDPLLSRAVAVKTLRLQLDPELRELLGDHILNEARAAAGLNHPNIVTVYDAGLCTPGVYIAMERLHGRDLRQALLAGWSPTPLQAAELTRCVAEALAYAHGKGVVHCDIKPANIFLDQENRPKVLDFGIARMTQDHQMPRGAARGTKVGIEGAEDPLFGSPQYLAPEQLEHGRADARTDVRALGVVLYELLTGRIAYNGNSLKQVVDAVLFNQPKPAHELRSGVPRTLSAIAERAMALDPQHRYATAEKMASELRDWCDHQAPASRPGRGNRTRAAARAQTRTARKPNSVGWAAGSVALCATAALGLWLASSPQPAEQQAPGAAGPGPDATRTSGHAANGTMGATTSAAGAYPSRVELAIGEGGHSNEGDAAHADHDGLADAGSLTDRPASSPEAKRPTGAAERETYSDKPQTREAAASGTGAVLLYISPWGEVEVNGRAAGTTPPLSRLSLPAGRHTITVRNDDFPIFTTTVVVQADKQALVRHQFVQ